MPDIYKHALTHTHITPNIQGVHPTVMLYSHRACSDVTSSFFIGMATGRHMGSS